MTSKHEQPLQEYYDDESDWEGDESGEEEASPGKDNKDHHNDLERKRRNEYGDNVRKLVKCIPELQGKKLSRRETIAEAARYITKRHAEVQEAERRHAKSDRKFLRTFLAVREAWLEGLLSDQEMAKLYNPLVGTKYEQMLKSLETDNWLTAESSDEGETSDEEEREDVGKCEDEGECEDEEELEDENEYEEEYEFEEEVEQMEGVLSDDEMSFGQSDDLEARRLNFSDLETPRLDDAGTTSANYVSGPVSNNITDGSNSVSGQQNVWIDNSDDEELSLLGQQSPYDF